MLEKLVIRNLNNVGCLSERSEESGCLRIFRFNADASFLSMTADLKLFY